MEQNERICGLRLYFRYIRLHFLSGFEYSGWPLMLLQTLFVVVTDPLGTILLFSRFGSIGAWSVERILLIYSLAVSSYGLAETFFRGFDCFPWKMVRTGDFDRLLLRPRPLMLQVAASFFHLHRLVRVLTGLGAVAWALWRMQIQLGPGETLLLVGALAGGCVLYAGVYVATSGIAIFTVKALDWIYILTNASYQVTRCPVEYMPRALYGLFTFLLPILVISYYPASVICGWGEPLWKGMLALPVGTCFMLLSHLLWRFGVRHYRSTGS